MDEVENGVAPQPLFPHFTTPAQYDVARALIFLRRVAGDAGAYAFNDQLDATVAGLCERTSQEIASHGKPFDAPNEIASLRFARVVYRERLETNRKRRRGSSSGLWYVYYALHGQTATSGADSLEVLAVRHSASEPFKISQSDDEPDDE